MKTIDVEISKLKDKFDIRCILNDDHIIYLAELIKAEVPLPPIKITKDFEIVDGRHRKRAYELAEIFVIKAVISDSNGTIDIVKEALSSNMGGALPLLKQDLLRTMTILINKGYSKPRIFKDFESILPLSLLKSSHHHALWAINRQKVNNAIDLIGNGLTIEKACELTGASLQAVKDRLERRKSDGNGNTHIKGTLSKMFSHFDKSLGKVVSKIFQDYEETEQTKSDTEISLKYLAKLITNQNRMYADWQKRWDYKK